MITEPLIRDQDKPTACRERGCSIELQQEAIASVIQNERETAALITHEYEGALHQLAIATEWLQDVERDIWNGDVRPWLDSLHPEVKA